MSIEPDERPENGVRLSGAMVASMLIGTAVLVIASVTLLRWIF